MSNLHSVTREPFSNTPRFEIELISAAPNGAQAVAEMAANDRFATEPDIGENQEGNGASESHLRDPIGAYLAWISQFPLLDGIEEERDLAKTIEAGWYASDLLALRRPTPPVENAYKDAKEAKEAEDAYEIAVIERELVIDALREGLVGRYTALLKSREQKKSPQRKFVGSGRKTPPKEGEAEAMGKRRNLPYEPGTETREGRESTIEALIERADSLTDEDVKDLELLAAAGDKAVFRFITANLRLVVSTARRYQRAGHDQLDIIQDGNLGLYRAVEKYDWVTGYKFSTYATWWIKQAISREMARNDRTIRLPVYLVDQINRMDKAERAFAGRPGHPPSVAELTEEMRKNNADKDITEKQVAKLRRISAMEPSSLDKSLGDGKKSTVRGETETQLGELIADKSMTVEDMVIENETVSAVNDALATLYTRSQQVIRMRFGLPPYDHEHTLAEVASELGVSRERVRQIESRALADLKEDRGNALRDL